MTRHLSFLKGSTSKDIHQPWGSGEEARDADGGQDPDSAQQVSAFLGVAPAAVRGTSAAQTSFANNNKNIRGIIDNKKNQEGRVIFNWGREMKSGLKVSYVYLVAGLRQLSPGAQPRPMKGLPKNVFLEAKGVLPMLLT